MGEDLPITYVDIVDRTKNDETAPAKIDREKLEAAITEMMREIPGYSFRTAKRGEREFQLDVTVASMRERTAIPEDGDPATFPEGFKRRSIGVEVALRPRARTADARSFATEAEITRNVAPEVTFDVLAAEALLDAARDLEVVMSLAERSPEDIVAMMSDEDEQNRRRAIGVARERKLREAVPRLCEIVRDQGEIEQLVLMAIGALVAIGDPSAAPALIDAGRQRPPSYLAQILYALAQLGGREAKGYLFTVQSGHPDEALRAVAKQALEELEAREQRAAPESPSP